MRPLLFLLPLVLTTATAQPGWQELQVSFTLQYHGEIIPPLELQQRSDFTFAMQGRAANVGGYGTDLNYTSFRPEESDEGMHLDTLWMEIMDRSERMRIGFPPRHHTKRQVPYTTNAVFIDFRQGQYMVTELPKRMHVTGTVANIEAIAGGNPQFSTIMRSGEHWSYSSIVDVHTGRIDAILNCNTFMGDRQEMVEFQLITQSGYGAWNTPMTIRVPYWPTVDLGSFDFVASHFRWNRATFVIDTTVPRDTIITGNHEGSEVRMHPVNPSPTDSLIIELRWEGSGAPYVSSYKLRKRLNGTTELRFTFALRTDVDVAADSWTEHGRPFRIPPLREGRYVLTQKEITGKDIAPLDLMIGKRVEFRCAERE